jgi:parallel beta-helix repeat protein
MVRSPVGACLPDRRAFRHPPASMSRAVAVVPLVLALAAPAAAAPPCTVTLAPGADVQRAIDGLPATGRAATVCLGPGTFTLRRFLSLRRDRLTLRGAGRGTTVLRVADGTPTPVVVVGDPWHRVPRAPVSAVSVEDLRVVGGGPTGSERCRRHAYLTNSAVVVRAGRRVTLRRLDVSRCRSACVLTEHDSRDVTIADDDVRGAVWDGVALNRTAKARITGNAIHANGAAGITAEHLEKSVLADNTITDNRTHGVYLSDSYRNVVRANRLADNALSGVYLTCAVRERRPPVLCWRDSMSAGNVFEMNRFAGNRVAFMVGADRAANCAQPGFVSNRSCADEVAGGPREDAGAARHGTCLVAGPRALAAPPAAR